MLINVLQPEECRIAILENNVLEELYVERSSHESYVGNIYKGRIVNIAGDKVTVDLNHPFAGKTLYFSGEVIEVREAHPVEIEHGHVHEHGDHSHH